MSQTFSVRHGLTLIIVTAWRQKSHADINDSIHFDLHL